MISTRAKVNTCEWISIRCGFTIYAAWVTTATILNITHMLKSFGVEDGETLSIIILWIALVIYNVVTCIERNPLFGGVFIWVINAIHYNIVNKKSEYEQLETNTTLIGIINCITIFGFSTYFANQYFQDKKIGLNSVVKHYGLFY